MNTKNIIINQKKLIIYTQLIRSAPSGLIGPTRHFNLNLTVMMDDSSAFTAKSYSGFLISTGQWVMPGRCTRYCSALSINTVHCAVNPQSINISLLNHIDVYHVCI